MDFALKSFYILIIILSSFRMKKSSWPKQLAYMFIILGAFVHLANEDNPLIDIGVLVLVGSEYCSLKRNRQNDVPLHQLIKDKELT